MKVFGGRAGLIGDTVMCLPLIPVLKKMYGEVDLTWPILKKCKQGSPLYIDQPGINSIYITKEEEGLNIKEWDWVIDNFESIINPCPNHPREDDWYNHRSCVEETLLMCGEQYYEVYKSLFDEDKLPKLNPWWKSKADNFSKNTIAIHTTAGYGKDFNRSPSLEWWEKLTNQLNKKYKIEQYGHPSDRMVNYNFERFNQYSLFEQIDIASSCEYYIGTDSGFSWIMGALGVKQISLMTNWLPNHRENLLALAPTNKYNKETNLFAHGGCDNIPIEDVLKLF